MKALVEVYTIGVWYYGNFGRVTVGDDVFRYTYDFVGAHCRNIYQSMLRDLGYDVSKLDHVGLGDVLSFLGFYCDEIEFVGEHFDSVDDLPYELKVLAGLN